MMDQPSIYAGRLSNKESAGKIIAINYFHSLVEQTNVTLAKAYLQHSAVHLDVILAFCLGFSCLLFLHHKAGDSAANSS